MSSSLDPHTQTLAQLTINAVLTLSMQAPSIRQSPGTSVLLVRTYTGHGKWTTLAMLGVRSNLRKAGCIEKEGDIDRMTPLGVALATAIDTDVQQALRMCRPNKEKQ